MTRVQDYQYEEGPEGGVVEGFTQLHAWLKTSGGVQSTDWDGTKESEKEKEYDAFREKRRESGREHDLTGDMLDRLSTCLDIDASQCYTALSSILGDMFEFYDSTEDETQPLLKWIAEFPNQWEQSIPKTSMRQSWKHSEEQFQERGGCRFYQSELWCPNGLHYSRCANGSPTCCMLHNLASVLKSVLTDHETSESVPWSALERMGPKNALEGFMACFFYTYNSQIPNDPSTPDIPRALERPVQIYSALNLSMREVGDPHMRAMNTEVDLKIFKKALELMRPLIKRLDIFVKALPRTPRTVFRGLAGHRVSKRYKQGAMVTWPAFTSTSGEPAIAWWFTGESGGTWFVIFADEDPAVDISWTSMYPTERELILPSNQVFQVAFKPGDAILTTLRTNNDVVILNQMSENKQKRSPGEVIDARIKGLRESVKVTFQDFQARYVEPQVSLNQDNVPEPELINLFDALGDGSTVRTAVIAGEAGSGKTSTILALSSVPSEQDTFKVFFSLPSIPNVLCPDNPPSIVNAIQRRFHLTDNEMEELKTRPMVLLLDSLDECTGEASYLKVPGSEPLLGRLGFKLDEWPNARVVLSTRTEYLRYWDLHATHVLGPDTQLFHVQKLGKRLITKYVEKAAREQVTSVVQHLHNRGLEQASSDKAFKLIPNSDLKRVWNYIQEHGPSATKVSPVFFSVSGALSDTVGNIVNRLTSDVHNAFQLSMAVDSAASLQPGDGRWQVYLTWCSLQIERKLKRLNADVHRYALPESQEDKIEYLFTFCEKLALSLFHKESWHGEVGPHAAAVAKSMNLSLETAMLLLTCAPLRLEDPEDSQATFSFVHRSLHEFLLARTLYKSLAEDDDLGCVSLLDHWSLACGNSLMLDLFGEAVRSSLRNNITEGKAVIQKLWDKIELSRDWNGVGKCNTAVNSMSMLVATGIDLGGADFSGVKIPSARLYRGHFKGASFRGADLRGVDIRQANLDECDFTEAQMDDWVCNSSGARLPLRTGLFPMLQEHGKILDSTWNSLMPQIIAVLSENRIVIYDVDAVRVMGEQGSAACIAWFPNDKAQLTVGSTDGGLFLWNFSKGGTTPVSNLSKKVTGIAYTKTKRPTLLATAGKTLFAFSEFSTCCMGKRKRKSLEFDSNVLGVQTSPKDNETAAVWCNDRSFSIVDASKMQVVWREEVDAEVCIDNNNNTPQVTHIAFNVGQSQIAVAAKSGRIDLYCYNTKSFLKSIAATLSFGHYYQQMCWARYAKKKKKKYKNVNRCAEMPSTILAAGATDALIRIISSVSDMTLPRCEGHIESVNTVEWHPTRPVLASGCSGGNLRFINGSQGKEGKGCATSTEKPSHTGTVTSIDWHPLRETVVGTGSSDGTIRTWHVPSGDLLSNSSGEQVTRLQYHPLGEHIMLGSDTKSLTCYSTCTGGKRWSLDEQGVKHFEWCPTGNKVYFTQDTEILSSYDVVSGKVNEVLKTGEHFRRNPIPGKGLMSVLMECGAGLVKVGTGEATTRLSHKGATETEWNCDGTKLATISEKCVKIWDVERGDGSSPLLMKTFENSIEGVSWNKIDPTIMGVYHNTHISVINIASGAQSDVHPNVGIVKAVSWHPTLRGAFACSGTNWEIEVYGRGQLNSLAPLLTPFDPSHPDFKLIRRVCQPSFSITSAKVDTRTCNKYFWQLAKSYGAVQDTDRQETRQSCRGWAISRKVKSAIKKSGSCSTSCVKFCTS